jgi:hypothetical protein
MRTLSVPALVISVCEAEPMIAVSSQIQVPQPPSITKMWSDDAIDERQADIVLLI